jgi:DNA topoisomerase-1
VLDEVTGNFIFIKQDTKETTVRKPSPLDMASYLQKMYTRYHYSNSKASVVSQKLYEKGLITYPRTDSKRISSTEFLNNIQTYVSKNFGEDYFEAPVVRSKGKSQDAHEAIRPTNINLTPEESGLTGEELKGYELVYKETLKSFMVNGKNISVKDVYEDGKHIFMIKSTVVKEPGFRAVDGVKPESLNDSVGQINVNKEQIEIVEHETQPPARYNQASLIKLMKEVGIGRPSTYTSTTTGLIKFGYLESVNGKLVPTEVAFDVNKLLNDTFPEIIDTEYTANMETDLDKIAEGEVEKDTFLHDF